MYKKIYDPNLSHIEKKDKMYFESGDYLFEVTPDKKQLYENAISHEKYILSLIWENEDSFIDLLEKDYPLTISAEDAAIHNIEVEVLHKAISELPKSDRQLIIGLFFYGETERHMARLQHCSHQRINKRKRKILERLKKKLQFF